MKIAIDAGPLNSAHSFRGVGVYAREIIKALGKKVEPVDVRKVDLSKYDVVHFTSFNPFLINFPLVKPKNTKFVLTIHDLIPLRYPKHFPPGVKGFIKWQINKLLIKRSVDAIVTVSETSKRDICKYLGVPFDKVHVIYNAPRSIFKRIEKAKYPGLPERFALYVGDINYNKNIPVLVAACKQINLPLVLAGKQAANIGKLNLNHPELSHLKGVDFKDVICLGFVKDNDLVSIYNLASVYIQPSLYEGFGIPVLEAFAVGCPVVASTTPALFEIAKGGALFADPESTNDFAEKIKRVIDDEVLRSQLIETGSVIVKNFTWEKAGEELLQLYERL